MDGFESLKMRLTAHSLIMLLSSEMYDLSAALWELVRNGLRACMPEGSKWVPSVGSVEVFLEKDHPLARGTTSLVVLDHGRGFTPSGLERFCNIGVSLELLERSQQGPGDSQKGIGRLAAFALNRKCLEDKDPTTGFYILTRTAERGDVRLLMLIPADIEREQKVPQRRLSADAPELGFLKGVQGSFTAIVIPNSALASYEEIRRALEWRMARKRDLAFKLKVGGTKVLPPPLASRVTFTSPDGTIEAYIDAVGEHEQSTSLWFADAATGLRVARADPFFMPFPYSLPQFFGDIFVPNLLANQRTDRAGLSPRYLKSQAWAKVIRYLGTQSEKLRALMGEEERPSNSSPMRETILELVGLCHKTWGVPEIKGEPMWSPRVPREGGAPRDSSSVASPRNAPPRIRSSTVESVGGESRPRGGGNVVRIGARTFVLWPHALDALTLAQVSDDGKMLWINERGYQLLPSKKDARREHTTSAIFFAVAAVEFPDSPLAAQRRAAQLRLELAGK